MIILHNVTKVFRSRRGESPVLRNVSAIFERGQNVAVFGDTGAGKTTFLSLISGTTKPDDGQVKRYGKVSWPIGQTMGMSNRASVNENLIFLARVRGVKPHILADHVAEFAMLSEDEMSSPLANLKGAAGKRFAQALVYALPFDWYLADDTILPTDQDMTERCEAALQSRLKTSNLIFATDDVKAALRYCNVGTLLEDGFLYVFEDLEEAARVFVARRRGKEKKR
jgi:capsular polysaccharide transport system ATP-binding protein